MRSYRDKQLVIRRDRIVVFDGTPIGSVYPDLTDQTTQHRWCYRHDSGITLQHLRPTDRWFNNAQTSRTKVDAAEHLVDLHLAIEADAGAAARATRERQIASAPPGVIRTNEAASLAAIFDAEGNRTHTWNNHRQIWAPSLPGTVWPSGYRIDSWTELQRPTPATTDHIEATTADHHG